MTSFQVAAQYDQMLDQLNFQIDSAARIKDYKTAARLQKEVDLIKKIQAAVNVSDYEKAKNLKDQLDAIRSGKTIPELNEIVEAEKKELEIDPRFEDISPEFINQIYIYESSAQSLKTLEFVDQSGKKSSKNEFYRSGSSNFSIKGINSTTFIKEQPFFMVEVSEDVIPELAFYLIQLDRDSENKTRNYQDLDYASLNEGFSYGNDHVFKKLTFQSLGNRKYKVITDELEAGEYAFLYKNYLYCFRILGQNEKIDFKKLENDKLKEKYLFSRKFFLDGMIGGGIFQSEHNYSGIIEKVFSPCLIAGIKLGSKWYFGQHEKSRPGFAATWIRADYHFAFGVNSPFYYTGLLPLVRMSPVNVGFVNLFVINELKAIELSLNAGPAFLIDIANSFSGVGVLVTPGIKYIHKKFCIGIDLNFAYYRSFSYYVDYGMNYGANLTIGSQF